MRWLIWPRQYGKSYRVMEWWLEDPNNRVILTDSEFLARIRRHDLTCMVAKDGYGLRDLDGPRLQRLLKRQVMSWRSWEAAGIGRTPQEVALDDCVVAILRQYVGVTGDLKIISEAGNPEEPDARRAAEAERMKAKVRKIAE